MTNYFDLYEQPVRFRPDAAAIKSKFYELSRRYHPDRVTMADDATRAEALRMSAMNNDAWKTLNNPDSLMAYILKLHGVLEEEEKYSLPPAFLMEMMDLNETLSDYEMEPANTTLQEQAQTMLQTQLHDWQQSITPLLDQFDNGDQGKELLLKIKDYYFRKKYLLRIQERMDTFASRKA
jgi:molecular chaperone HscB